MALRMKQQDGDQNGLRAPVVQLRQQIDLRGGRKDQCAKTRFTVSTWSPIASIAKSYDFTCILQVIFAGCLIREWRREPWEPELLTSCSFWAPAQSLLWMHRVRNGSCRSAWDLGLEDTSQRGGDGGFHATGGRRRGL